ncbi:hypothetical protein C8R45DRAFT_597693 [Mycena sanguinolenta]|nr:hypothetical protein C8R45DRAFT_597693 [Mycena sanguinolenta]
MKRIVKLVGKSKSRASSVPPSSRVPDPSAPSLTTLTRPASPQTAPASLPRKSPSSASQTAWTNLKKVLKALCNGSDLYPPLKAALSEVTSAMESIEHVGDVNNEFRRITENVRHLQRIFSQYESEEDIPPAMHAILDAMTSELTLIDGAIRSKMRRGHILEAPAEVEKVLAAFERFSSTIERLQLSMGLHVSNYSLNILGGVGGAGGMSEQGTAGSGGIGQGPNVHIHAVNSTINAPSSDVLAKLTCIDSASIDAQQPEGCLKGTRVKILADLQAWSQDPHAPRIFWLDGMAGTGKSAILFLHAR